MELSCKRGITGVRAARPAAGDRSQGFFVEELSGVQMTKIMFRLHGPRMEVALLGREVRGPCV